jgi:hypothetical protein
VFHNGKEKDMKNRIILILLLVISKVTYADISFTEQEIPKVTPANNGYEFTIPYFELQTPFGITAYKVKLVASSEQSTFFVDLSTLQKVAVKQRVSGDVPAKNPIAMFTKKDNPLSLDASESYALAGRSIVKYDWLVNDQPFISTTSPILSNSVLSDNGKEPFFCNNVFLVTGNYSIKLTVIDNQGLQGSIVKNIYIERPLGSKVNSNCPKGRLPE